MSTVRLSVVAILALLIALLMSHRESAAYRRSASTAGAYASVARLAGMSLSKVSLPLLDGGRIDLSTEGAGNRDFWIIDPSKCPSRLREIPTWGRTVRARIGEPQAILVGVGHDRAQAIARQHDLPLAVAYDSTGSAAPPPLDQVGSVKMLVDPHGLVLLAGVNQAPCDWPFEEQVVRLREDIEDRGRAFDELNAVN